MYIYFLFINFEKTNIYQHWYSFNMLLREKETIKYFLFLKNNLTALDGSEVCNVVVQQNKKIFDFTSSL